MRTVQPNAGSMASLYGRFRVRLLEARATTIRTAQPNAWSPAGRMAGPTFRD